MPGKRRNHPLTVKLSGVYAEKRAQDARIGDYTRERLERINRRFCAAIERALHRGSESPASASASFTTTIVTSRL